VLGAMNKAIDAARSVPPKCLTLKMRAVVTAPAFMVVAWWATSGNSAYGKDR
jgi:hypothetical protein